jgi:starch synthase
MIPRLKQILRIVFIAAESLPWVKEGGLGDVMGSLPKALHARDHEVLSILPLYKSIDRKAHRLKELTTIHVRFMGQDHESKVFEATYPGSDCRALFIEHPFYFGRDGTYGDPVSGAPWPDDDERWCFFQCAALELLASTQLAPDIIVCADWHTALVPALLRIRYAEDRYLERARSVLALHNLGYHGLFPKATIAKLGLPSKLIFPLSPFEFYGQLNSLKAGICFADEVITVSPSYAEEIQTERFGHGLDGVLREHRKRLTGVLNGIDEKIWTPARDPHLEQGFSIGRLSRKTPNRAALLKKFGLDADFEGPVASMVTRLTGQKGMHLLSGCIDQLMKRDFKLLILGSGEPQFEAFLKDVAKRNKDRMAVHIGYSESLAHQVYAGSDFFLMPSQYEPCGLSQMYAMRYGTPPIVHAVGGLKDTVKNWIDDPEEATGFTFDTHTAEAFMEVVDQALSLWKKPLLWRKMQRNGMRQDFSWKRSAGIYEGIFRKLRALPHFGG